MSPSPRKAPSLEVFTASQQIKAEAFGGHRHTDSSLYRFVRKDITMDTDEDLEGKAREAEGKACGKGPVLIPDTRLPGCLEALQASPFIAQARLITHLALPGVNSALVLWLLC